MEKIYIDGNSLTLTDFIKVARHNYKIDLTESAKEEVERSRRLVEKFVNSNKTIYGITTGFGKFSEHIINKEESKRLQRNLIVSHACGVGHPLKEEYVRGIILLRINALAKGYSGIRLSTLNTLIEMLNKGIHPIIPEKGSLGASGDLAPLAHMALVLIGKGEAIYQGERMSGQEAMKRANIKAVELTSKEGLALINGTQVMTAIGAFAIYEASRLSKLADISAALTIEALNGIIDAYDKKIGQVRKHEGQVNTAANLRLLLKGSKMITRQGEARVQDAYSLRCVPQVHGASKDTFKYVQEKIEIEMNSATDNPLIFTDSGEVISGGNFHGQPLALPFDFLGIAVAELANISERRIERLVNPTLNNGLPAFLIGNAGLNSGFMITQYVAASLVSENKVLSHPASVDSIPSSANQEDHVSMGTIAARKAAEIIDNAYKVIAIEAIAACQAIDLRAGKELGLGTQVAYSMVREGIKTVKEDKIMYVDICDCEEMLRKGGLVGKVEKIVGQLW